MKGKVISVKPVLREDGMPLESHSGNVKYDVAVEMGETVRALVAWGDVGSHLLEGEVYDFEVRAPKTGAKYQDWTITDVSRPQIVRQTSRQAPSEPMLPPPASPKKAEFRDPVQIIRSTAIGVAANIIAALADGEMHTQDLFRLARMIEVYVTSGEIPAEKKQK